MGRKKTIILVIIVGVATSATLCVAGGYFVLREVLAPEEGSLVRRVGLAGLYVVEHGREKFLVNSLGGMEKLDTDPVPAPNSVDARSTSATEANVLPTPPTSSYASEVLKRYSESVRQSAQINASLARQEQELPTETPATTPRSSFLEDRQVKASPTPEITKTPASVSQATPLAATPAVQATPPAHENVLRSIDRPSASASPTPQPSPENARDEHPPLKHADPNAANIRAAWAGYLAAENVTNPKPSAILTLKAPETKTGPNSDTAPTARDYIVDDALDAAPRDANETYTLLNPPPTPSPDELVPSASVSPAPPREHLSPVAPHYKPHRKTLPETPAKKEKPKLTFWKKMFGTKETKQEEKPGNTTAKN